MGNKAARKILGHRSKPEVHKTGRTSGLDGCGGGGGTGTNGCPDDPSSANQDRERPSTLPPDILTDEEVEHIKLTWPYFKAHLKMILTKAFIDLFNEHPDIKDKFMSFKNYTIADLQREEYGPESALQRHVPRVARVIMKVVNQVDNLDNVLSYLGLVGKLHYDCGVMSYELKTLGPFFVASGREHLPAKHRSNPDLINSWHRFFVVMSDLMTRGYPDVEFELSMDERRLVKRSFHILNSKAVSKLGQDTFVKLFDNYARAKEFFPDFRNKSLEEMHMDKLKDHGLRLIKVIGKVVNADPNSPEIDEYLMNLGTMHQTYSVERKYLDVIGPVFVESIRPLLHEDGEWNLDVRHAWLHFFRVVALKMKRGYVDEVAASAGVDAGEGGGEGANANADTRAEALKNAAVVEDGEEERVERELECIMNETIQEENEEEEEEEM